ncbi:TorF family putative porin [Alteromonas sp. ASW11-19]|uniref:TorF family putative porin n=1 Tax=Alteromonas salexigens TaxID=2982530 RepID=A0ABT2VKN4_9ALTE|nr:TorF family putative porin [Alteromonas salexigens]MCU7553855.1 TorF family putative porin [Alteromonas salexigens]
MKKSIMTLALLSCWTTGAMANWSVTVTGASDYMFNGVSQTDNDPALQASLDYAASGGVYAGVWTSNVDYGASADQELDGYIGHFVQLDESVSVDYGIAYYTYHGGDDSSELNYPEMYAKFGYGWGSGTTEANFWYTWDYFGTGAGHTIVEIAHTIPLAENHALRISADSSNSLDGDKWSWEGSDTSYQHVKIAWQTSWQGFAIEVAAENTTLDSELADERIVVAVSRTFSF